MTAWCFNQKKDNVMKKSRHETEFGKLIDVYRQSLDVNLPLTKAQMARLEEELQHLPPMPDEIDDPDALLARGYVRYEDILQRQAQLARGYVAYSELIDNKEEMVNEHWGIALAARNGEEISQESMQKIIKLIDGADEKSSQD